MPRQALIDGILSNATAVSRWLGEPEGAQVIKWLKDWKAIHEKHLHTSQDGVELYRAQGALEILDRILELRDEIHEYQRKVLKGDIQPIKKENIV